MVIRFGNLSPEQMGERMGWSFNEDDLAWLKAHHVESAQTCDIMASGGFHIFDSPFQIVCVPSISKTLCNILKTYDARSKGLANMQIVELNEGYKND